MTNDALSTPRAPIFGRAGAKDSLGTPLNARPMTRILFAWELGSNLGHLTRDLPLARACRAAGFSFMLAVPTPQTVVDLH